VGHGRRTLSAQARRNFIAAGHRDANSHHSSACSRQGHGGGESVYDAACSGGANRIASQSLPKHGASVGIATLHGRTDAQARRTESALGRPELRCPAARNLLCSCARKTDLPLVDLEANAQATPTNPIGPQRSDAAYTSPILYFHGLRMRTAAYASRFVHFHRGIVVFARPAAWTSHVSCPETAPLRGPRKTAAHGRPVCFGNRAPALAGGHGGDWSRTRSAMKPWSSRRPAASP